MRVCMYVCVCVCSLVAAGGRDCTRDYEFHRKDGRKLWKSLQIGRVVPCTDKQPHKGKKPWLLGLW